MKTIRIFILTLFLGILLAGCAAQPDRLWPKAPDWSRAKLIGNTRVGDPVPIAIDDQQTAYLFYIQSQNDQPSPRVIAFYENGDLAWDRSFSEYILDLPAEPQILWDGTNLLLFWINDYRLYGASLDTNGDWIDTPKPLSANHQVNSIEAVVDDSGRLKLWFSSPLEEPGLYAVESALTNPQIQLIDPDGTNPDLRFDDEGTLHALWARNPTERGMNDFVYGVYPSGNLESGKARTVYSPVIYGTTVLDGPHLGIDSSNTYIFWSVTFFSGPEAGTVRAQYVYLPRGEFYPVSTPRLLSVPWSHDLEYVEAKETAIESGRRVPLGQGFNGGGRYIVQINPNQKSHDELVFTFQARLGYLMRKVQAQVALVYLDGGTLDTYQELSFTQSQSSTPSVTSDDQGYLYLSWLEKGELPGWAIYFTSTAPGFVEGFGGASVDDVTRVSIEALFGLAIGALLIPIAISWVLPSTLILAVGMRISDWIKENSAWGNYLSVGLAIIAAWIAKLGILPGITSYVPFSAWIPFLPRSLDLALRIAAPLFILAAGLLGAWLFTRTSEEKPVFQFFFAYCIIDGLLSMAIYGVLIIATF
jgi:hypothetical protein